MNRPAVKAGLLSACFIFIVVVGWLKPAGLKSQQNQEVNGDGALSGALVGKTGKNVFTLHDIGNPHFDGSRQLLAINEKEVKTTVHPDEDVDCKDYHKIDNITNKEICVFVNSTDSCAIDEGFINYLVIIYCQMTSVVPLGVFVFFLWWLFLFIGLATTADDFFCPALEVISKTLKLSHNIGVTFLAFGNGAPDIFSAIAAIGSAKNNDAGLAIGALFGAGIFVTTVVVGAISITMPFTAMERPFLRDIVFYLAAVFWTFYVLYDGVMYTGEAIGFICLYIGYVLVVIIGRFIRQRYLMRERFNEEVPEQQTISINEDAPIITTQDTPYGSIRSVHQNGSLGTPEQTIRVRTPVPERSIKDLAHVAETLTVSAVLGHDVEEQPTLQPQRSGIFHETVCESEDEELRSLVDENIKHKGVPTLLSEFLSGVCPIDVEGWSEMKIIWKIYEVFKAPVLFLLLITIPVVDYSEDKHKWNKLLNCLQVALGPVFCVAAINKAGIMINGQFPVIVLVLLISLMLSIIVFCTSRQHVQPIYHPAFAYLGFVVSVIWIYSIANEIVNILQMFGVIFSISDGILGLTLLAWGNSVGDLIADTVMAKQGFPRMGVSACFGGPLFNLLLGIGIPFTIGCIQRGGTFELKLTLLQVVLALFLTLSLLSSLIIIPLRKFYISRSYGAYLLVLYLTFIAFAVLVETNVLTIPGIDNH